MRLRFTNYNAKYDTVHTIDYDSHVQYFAGRVHLRSLVFLSARAARACHTRPRAQFSLVQTDRMCCKYMYRCHSARHAASRTLIFFLCTSYNSDQTPSPLMYSVRLKKISEIYGRPLKFQKKILHEPSYFCLHFKSPS